MARRQARGLRNVLNLHFQSGLQVALYGSCLIWQLPHMARRIPDAAPALYGRRARTRSRASRTRSASPPTPLTPGARPNHRSSAPSPFSSCLIWQVALYGRFDPLNYTYSSAFHAHVLRPLEAQGVDAWWLDWQQGDHTPTHPFVPW